MKIGIVTGSFDLLHAGHVHLIKEAAKRCGHLIVALHADPSLERANKHKPVESIIERTIRLDSNENVNDIIVYEKEEDLPLIFKYYDVNVRFLGSEYMNGNLNITDPDAVEIVYIDSLPIHTSGLRARIANA
jgi:glycerol-3-phosphate cytidylyltransferase